MTGHERKEVAVLYLDLDGTVRQGKDDALGRFVNGPDDVIVFPEAVKAMTEWRAAGGRIVGVTNQGGIALGHMSVEACVSALEETNRQTGYLFDGIVFCTHHPAADTPKRARCWCRKPSPGLIIEGARELVALYPDETYPPYLALMVGDRPEDQECAKLAGADFMWAHEWREAYS